MATDTADKMANALDTLALGMEDAVTIVERNSPMPFEMPSANHEHIANAIVRAGNIQATAALVATARGYVAGA